MSSNDVYFTTGEVAKYLGVSQSTVGNYIKRGLLVPDICMPSFNGKKGRQKFSEGTLVEFKTKLIRGEF